LAAESEPKAHRSRAIAAEDVTTGRAVAAATSPISYALAVLARAHRNVLQARLAELGLHLGQELLVVELHANPGSTQGELGERLEIQQPTVAKALLRMERSGFVSRRPDPANHRIVRLDLTPKGQAAVDRVLKVWSDVEHLTVEPLTEPERSHLLGLLDKARQSLA
jgi:DNA-binding MarR family transcriptional regulator